MSKARVIVLSVVHQGLTKADAARKFDVSWQWVNTLVTRYQTGGLDALEPQSRRPRSSPNTTPEATRSRILQLRRQLETDGLDAGPVTIAWHLERERINVPAISTIRRILNNAGLIVAEPAKRPRSSFIRFAADQPNETWQSDFTHWALADGTDVEILNWLDDHSRLLLSCTAHTRVTGPLVVTSFTRNINEYGPPASTLTDNGTVYTARFTRGKNAFEYLLTSLGITQKNGHPYHPQTQGKIERFHQTLKLWLGKQLPAMTISDLQAHLDRFQIIYNEHRPHRALDRHTPQQAYDATLKATPQNAPLAAHYRVRTDTVDRDGKVSIRRAGKMHHLGIGRAHTTEPVMILIDENTATVTHLTTGEILSNHLIEPEKSYWRDHNKKPGRWPGPS
ncbi:MAG: IS481 family transposase [Herbiconiux sp.]|uniref:IS481 family transposase n=1 Tax=Herbiconiux sp. TaxID=1871186 RepID=UPI00121C5C59|nr:IS481 family transposase [Herbiconiux sp.]TAJ46709.1 MAG: IS481 family transposase [Herbiconiux sp.]